MDPLTYLGQHPWLIGVALAIVGGWLIWEHWAYPRLVRLHADWVVSSVPRSTVPVGTGRVPAPPEMEFSVHTITTDDTITVDTLKDYLTSYLVQSYREGWFGVAILSRPDGSLWVITSRIKLPGR